MITAMADYLKTRLSLQPKIGLILGTGLGAAVDDAEILDCIPYEEVPGFPVSTVAGHAGRFLAGYLSGQPILVMQGRVHYYEGYRMEELAIPVRVMKKLGVETLIVTNASGGICPEYHPGELVLISDHIKLAPDSPLRGANPSEFGERFFDMTTAYTPRLRALAKEAAATCGMELSEGVYAYMGGPQFETPAEIRMLRMLGADLVGMSTVPEVICAVHCGLEVLGVSCVTNMAAGMEQGGLNSSVIDRAEREGKEHLKTLLAEVIARI